MKSHSIVVSDADMDRLSRLVMALKRFLSRDQLQVESLNQTLESAEIASSEHIPRDVIKMNSRIHVLDLDTGKKERAVHAGFPGARRHICRPHFHPRTLGIALLGRRQQDIIEARVPGGIRRLRVERVLHRTGGKQARPGQTEKPSLARNIQTAGLAA